MPVAPKKTVLQAVETLYGSLGGLPTLWLDEVPENQGYPRATLNDGGRQPTVESLSSNDGNVNYAEVFGTFTISFFVEDDSDQAEALAVTVMEAFTPFALQLTIDPGAVMFRTSDKVSGEGERSPADKPVYKAELEYRVELSPPY